MGMILENKYRCEITVSWVMKNLMLCPLEVHTGMKDRNQVVRNPVEHD